MVIDIKLLLIKSDSTDLLTIQEKLAQCHFSCHFEFSTSLSEAYAKTSSQRYDAIVLSVDLVDDKTPALILELNQQCIPLIILAEVGEEDTVIQLMQQGASDYLLLDPDRNALKLLPITAQKAIAALQAKQHLNHGGDCRTNQAAHQWQERLLEGQRKVLEQLALDRPLTHILKLLLHVIEEQDGPIGSILLLEGNQLKHGVSPSLPQGYVQALGNVTIGPQAGSCGTAAFRQEPVIVTDIATDPLWANYRDIALAHNLRACWSVPILSRAGVVLGTFALYHREPYSPTPQDWQLLNLAVNLAALAIERKQTELALIQSEERFRATFEQAAVGICHVGLDGHFLRFNQRFCEIIGYPPDKIQSLTFQEITYPEDLPLDLQMVQQLLRGKRSTYTLEKRYIRQNRSIVWASFTVSLVRDLAGKPAYFIGVIENISDRKQAEVKLRLSEQRYGALAAAVPVGIFCTNSSGECLYVNDRWCQIAGLLPTQALGNGWAEALYLGDREHVFAAWKSAVQARRSFQLEYRLQRPDGKIFWVFGQAVAEHSPEGEITGYVGTITDITVRKQAEAALRNFNQELEQRVRQRTAELQQTNHQLQHAIAERQKLVSLVENSADFIAIATPSGQMTYLNQAGRQCVGLDQTEDITTYQFSDFLFPTDQSALQSTFLVILTGGESWQGEIQLRHRQTQAAVPMMHSAFPIKQPQTGDILAIACISHDITDRKLAEAAIRESERRFISLSQAAPVAIFRFNKSGQCVYVNDRWSEMNGKPAAAAMGSQWLETIHPDDRERINVEATEWVQTCRAGELYRNEARILRPDGSTIWFFCQMLPETDADGTITGYIGTLTDISDRKQAEVALQENEATLKLFVKHAPIGIAMLDTNLNYVLASQCWVDNYKLDSIEAILGRSHYEIFPEIPEHWRQIHQKCLAGATEQCEAELFLREDGSTMWIRWEIRPWFTVKQKIGGIFIVSEDITERKQAEIKLRESEERYRALMEGASDAILIADLEGNLLSGNRTAEKLLGYSRAEISQLTVDQIHPPPDLDRHITLFSNIFYTRSEQLLNTTVLHKDGTIIPVDITASLIEVGGKSIVLGSFRDITERKAAELALRDSEARFRNYFEQALVGMAITSPTQKLIEVNDKLCEILGYSREHLTQLNWDALTHPDDLIVNLANFEQVLSGQRDGYAMDKRFIRKDGEIIYASIAVRCLRKADSSVDYFIVLIQDITARKQAEKQLRESEASLLEAQRVAHIGNWVFDPSSQTITWSEELYRMFRLDPTQPTPTYEEYLTQIHPSDRAALVHCVETAIAQGTPYIIDYQVILPDGSIRYHEGRGETVRDHNGQVIKLLGTALDITDRKQAEIELKRNRELRDAIFNKSTDALFLVDSTTELITDCNERAIEMFEANSKADLLQISGNTLQRRPFSPQELEGIIEELNIFGFWSREVEYVTQKGKFFWANMAGTTVKVADEPIRLVRLSDITDRKLIELLLHQQLEKEQLFVSVLTRIRESLDLKSILQVAVNEVRSLIQSDRVFVCQVNQDGTGLALAEALAGPWRPILNESFPVEAFPPSCYQCHIQGQSCIIDDRDTTLTHACMIHFMQDFEIRAKLVVPIVRQEDKKLWGLLIAHQCSQPRHWLAWEIELLQQLAGQLAIAIQQANLYQQAQAELVERQRAEATLQTANEQLQIVNMDLARATRLKDEFLANMSHELRTPLNAILGMAEVLQEEVLGDLNEQQQKAIGTIEHSGKHLLDLINDILDLAKIEAGKLELSFSDQSIQTLCNSSLNLIKQMAYQKNIQINTQISPHLNQIELDDRRMRQVLINLLSNAIKFTPEGGAVTLEVWQQSTSHPSAAKISETQAATTSSFVYFAVTDTGIGIAPEDMPKLFHTFVQIDSSLNRQYNGTGLGLALVKRITELHGGWVQAESELGQGSRFTVVLPHRPPAKSSDRLPALGSSQQATAHVDNTPLQIPIRQPQILLAEDNQANIETYSNYLVNFGYQVIVATNGLEAVSLAKQHQPDLILMDIQMPVMDGLEATRQIRAIPELSQTPLIALTALVMPGDREKCIEVGANEYIAKPVRLRHLVNRISQLLSL
ncbi:MAG TPA: PAS domain S-box protein [Leptolyngbyaceae cyanobacterium M33_DOE_097]|uniref:Circadian input-output histidine kinase CikA n=1 Tax=Oscillatoriales cyanobacterium SpSt-418 TaxID=2282169 RepID=A0A7C3PGU2_9CYAN|nr:PAS domain S-box protein [Leptolyngbyaceae cyanobacterium M33_DOE_097]